MKKRTYLPLSLFVAFATLAAKAPPYPSFTADVEMTAHTTTQTGKVTFAKGKMRSEMSMGSGEQLTSIVDYGGSKVYLLMPPPRGCLEQPVQFSRNDPFVATIANAEEEVLGEEEIDGHPTKKVRVKSNYGGEPHTSLLWKAQDLKGLPIRVEAEDGSFKMTYKNVKLGEPDAKLLTPPADCKPNPFGQTKEPKEKGAKKK